eukprot:c7697_g1_i2.p1 GENE.c7697_g1_i2~~c7697_g1_i2.p1  ORF type:complete len:280 (-),score=43.00 c7697_g1_i2:99-908(-)
MSENSTDKGEEVEEQTKHTCIICLDRIVDIRLPCGHAVMCETCLRELKHRSNKCPTCRVPFDKYFVLEADDDHHLVRSPSFINPERSIAPFGALRRFSSETTIHNDRPTASAHQAHPTNTRHRISGPDCGSLICYVICGIIFGPVVIWLAFAIYYFFAMSGDIDRCTANSSNWFTAFLAVISLYFFPFGVFNRTAIDCITAFSAIILFVWGYQILFTSRYCPLSELPLSWYLMAIALAVVTVPMLLCCGCMSCLCSTAMFVPSSNRSRD